MLVNNYCAQFTVMDVDYKKICLVLFTFFMNYHYSHGACEPLTSTATTNVTCKYNAIILENCTSPIEGTIALFSCKPFYEEVSILTNPIRSCEEGKWNGPIPKCYPICGEKRSDKGFPNTPITSPWHVGIYNKNKDYLCSGTLIDTNVVLTNARCITNSFAGEPLPRDYLLVTAGKYYSGYDDKRDKFAQYAQVLKIIVPDAYAAFTTRYEYDIGIVILKNPFSLSLMVQPACIDFEEKTIHLNELLNMRGVVTTWVSIFRPPDEDRHFEDLRELKVSLLSYEKCVKELDIPIANLVTYDKLCGGITGCYDHHGGGLVAKNIFNEKHYVKAVVHAGWSRPHDCAANRHCLVTLVGYHIDFVKNYAARNHSSQKYCQLPNYPLHGEYFVRNRSDIFYEPGKDVLPHTVIFLHCKTGYEVDPPHSNQFYCVNNGEWAPALRTCTQKPFNYIVYISAAVVVTGFLGIIGVFIKMFYNKKRTAELQKKLKFTDLQYFLHGDLKRFNPELGIENQTDMLPYNENYEFPKDKLKFGEHLGSGAFGVVIKAQAFGIIPGEEKTTVAVKMLKETTDYIYWKALLSELKIMNYLGKHVNVVNFLGACTKNLRKCEVLVIVEYCQFGNLYNYLLRNRNNYVDEIHKFTRRIDDALDCKSLPSVLNSSSISESIGKALTITKSEYSKSSTGSTIPADDQAISSNSSESCKRNGEQIRTKDLISWAFQVANGMEYLGSKKVLHGDLAARNILLADNNIVKICDFGLAKQLYKCIYYRKQGDSPLPIKWMAIESIRDRVFSTQSDVWSYGILLWELFSLSEIPYPDMEADEKLYKILLEGYRMSSPAYAPKEIYKLMCDCWNAKPLLRPTFGKLVDTIALMLEENDDEAQT